MNSRLHKRSRLAVLIDAENVSRRYIGALLDELSGLGTVFARRIYGDWTRPDLASWRDVLHEHAIIPVQQYRMSSGKNCTDCALIIDAMDLLYSGRFDGFCIVSSDSDFTRLACRLRESALVVLGAGESKTPAAFVKSCDRFIALERLASSPEPESPLPSLNGAGELPGPRAESIQRALFQDAYKASAREDGWATLASFGAHVRRLSPSFDPRAFGCKSLSQLVESLGLFETRRVTSETDARARVWHLRWKTKSR